jgi:hypothetical protein
VEFILAEVGVLGLGDLANAMLTCKRFSEIVSVSTKSQAARDLLTRSQDGDNIWKLIPLIKYDPPAEACAVLVPRTNFD